MLLAHNHIMLVLRAFLTGAKWELPTDKVRGITYCDADGKLSVTAVAGSPNGKELGEILDGFQSSLGICMKSSHGCGDKKVRIGAPVASSDSPAQLVELGETQGIRAVDDDGIGPGDGGRCSSLIG